MRADFWLSVSAFGVSGLAIGVETDCVNLGVAILMFGVGLASTARMLVQRNQFDPKEARYI
jgi:hypothetical protein